MSQPNSQGRFLTVEDALRIKNSVKLPLPTVAESVESYPEFRDQLDELLKSSWYASLGMVDPDASSERRHLRERLAKERGIEPNDRRLRRLGDRHINFLVEEAGWFYERWWDRPVAASRTGETTTEASHSDGPFVRLVQEIALALALGIENDTLPADWLRASTQDTAERIAKRLRKLADGTESARDAIRKSAPYGVLRRLEPHLDSNAVSPVPFAYGKDKKLAPLAFSDQDVETILKQVGEEHRENLRNS